MGLREGQKRQTGQRGAPCGRTIAGKTNRAKENKESGRGARGKLTRRRGDGEGENRQTIPSISDNSLRRQPKQLGTTLSRCAAQPGSGRQRKGPSNRRLGGATFQSRHSGWSVGGEREERIYKNVSNAAARTRRDWKGEELNIENHENRFADMERREGSGCAVGARAARPRGGWEVENTRNGQCFL